MTNIDHLNPPTGHMADNIVGFARALRAAGIPVGPGAVIDGHARCSKCEMNPSSPRPALAH